MARYANLLKDESMKCRRNNFKRRKRKYNKLGNNLLLSPNRPIISEKRKRKDYKIKADYNFLQDYNIFLTSGKRIACLVLLPSIVLTLLFSILDINKTHVGNITIKGILVDFILFNFALLVIWFIVDSIQGLIRICVEKKETKSTRWEARAILLILFIKVVVEIIKIFL